jgi:hypothetical protein
LPWGVLDAIAGEAIPVTDPHPAKGAIAIEDEEWAVWHYFITPELCTVRERLPRLTC